MDKCFACDKTIKGKKRIVDTRDGQTVYVGPDCYKNVIKAGESGLRHSSWNKVGGNLRLYPLREDIESKSIALEKKEKK